MAALSKLAAVTARLEALVSTAQSARTELEATKVVADSMSSSVEVLRERTAAASGGLRDSMTTASEAVSSIGASVAAAEAAADGMTKTRERIETDARAAEAAATGAAERIRQRMGEFEEQATRLDDLKFRLQGSSNEWDAELKLMIAAVEVGAKSMTDLMDLWGDAMIDGKRLREFLAEMPLDHYQQRMNDLIHGIREGSKGVSEAIDLLKGSQIEFAQSFARLLELFQQGKVTIGAVLQAANDAARMFPDSQFADLAKAVAEVSQPGGRF